MRPTLPILAFLALPAAVPAQTTPFLTDDEIRMLASEISGDRAFEHIRWLSHWHRDSGMEGYFKAAKYVVKAAKEAGLQDVRFIEQKRPGPSFTAREAELRMVEPADLKLADRGDHAVFLADGSHSADVTAELVWIGDASDEALRGRDVAGKIVLTSAHPAFAARQAVWGKGAAGVVSFHTGARGLDYPDQVAWSRIPIDPPDGKKGTFAFMLSRRKGEALRDLLESSGEQEILGTGRRAPGGRIVVRARVRTEIGRAPSRTGFVEGWIRGNGRQDQQIVITAHLQEEQGSANDDGSGCGSILEIARALNRLIETGRIPRPKRDIRFWWTDEIYSEYRWFRDHPEEPARMLANLHQDMTGANQAIGSRVQHLILPPHSRTSWLDTLFESLGTWLIETNNAYLAAGLQNGQPRPFSRPIVAARGTRQGYNARFVPYFDSSDHMCFVEGAIGVPAVALINWDDDFIHSTDDDLWQIDQTQLQRNSFLIAAMAWHLGWKVDSSLPTLAAETFACGGARLAKDLKAALGILRGPGEPAQAWKQALIVVEQGIEREVRALQSIRVFGVPAGLLEELEDRTVRRESEMRGVLRAAFRELRGGEPPAATLTTEEAAAAAKVPVNAAPLEAYFARRDRVSARTGLHGLMRDEVFNFVDGRRSFYDIYKAVFAEAAAAGAWYYGTVTLKDVAALLDAAVEAKALVLRAP